MGAWIIIRTEVHKDKLFEFFQALDKACFPSRIAYTYAWKDTVEICFDTEKMGYDEPFTLYEHVKDYVIDVWSYITSDAELEPGKDNGEYVWESCKKFKDKDDKVI